MQSGNGRLRRIVIKAGRRIVEGMAAMETAFPFNQRASVRARLHCDMGHIIDGGQTFHIVAVAMKGDRFFLGVPTNERFVDDAAIARVTAARERLLA